MPENGRWDLIRRLKVNVKLNHICGTESLKTDQFLRQLQTNSLNLNTHHCVPNSQPLVPILSQMYPVHTLLACFFKINFNIILASVPGVFQEAPFLQAPLPKTLCLFHPSPMWVTCPIKRAQIWSSSLCIFLQPPCYFLLLTFKYSAQPQTCVLS